MLLDNFAREMNRTFTSYVLLDTLDANFNPDQGFNVTATITGKKCAFYEGSAAEMLVSRAVVAWSLDVRDRFPELTSIT